MRSLGQPPSRSYLATAFIKDGVSKRDFIRRQPDAGPVAQNWFDQLESRLVEDARVAGLLEHGASVGAAREFSVESVLRSFLPPAVHIGTGQIVKERGGRSKQIDVIVYDPRFPVLEIRDGFGLYFVEGVIAAIEVKSFLNKPALVSALDNCLSVMELAPQAIPECVTRQAERIKRRRNISDRDAWELGYSAVAPHTYVFAYRGFKRRPKAMCTVIDDWYQAAGQPGYRCYPYLPRVVAAEG